MMALEPCMGWDGLDEIRVQLRGMRTQTFVDLPFRHHRAEGGRELTSLHHGEALGRASWYMGYRPTYLALRALYRLAREPAALAMLWGYAAAAAQRATALPGRAGGARAARPPAAGRRAAARRAGLLSQASPAGAPPWCPSARSRRRSRDDAEQLGQVRRACGRAGSSRPRIERESR